MQTTTSRPYICLDCNGANRVAAFPTEKALLAHQRRMHGKRNPFRYFVDARCVCVCMCPVCACSFSTRSRTIAHLSEKRNRSNRVRQSCGQILLGRYYRPLPDDVVEGLDKKDAEQRASARRRGHTQPQALWVAKRGNIVQNSYGPQVRVNGKRSPDEIAFVCKRPRIADVRHVLY